MLTSLLLSTLYNPTHILVKEQEYRECIVTEETKDSKFANDRFASSKENKTKKIVCY